jgi:putative peptide zinc metalloprotease protein
MTTTSAPAGARFAVLSMVRDGDGYVLGSTVSRDFVAVPAIGGDVVRWLQAGYSVEECAELAARQAGEPVDVNGFVNGLTEAGLLPAEGAGPPVVEPPRAAAAWAGRSGRVLFGRAGLAVQVILAVVAVVAMVVVPPLRPRYTDVIVTGVPLLNLFVVSALAIAAGLMHEVAHVIAAAARGVPGRVSISRRMISIVYQTDLTRLWSVPRPARVVPLLAGIVSDAATVAVLVVVEATVLRGGAPLVVHLVRAMIFVKTAGIVFQVEVFMRTDLYALFVVATGCRNLWATKGAVARRAIGRATADDVALLATVGAREIFWARIYLVLYVPGVAWTVYYLLAFVVPAVHRNAAMSVDTLATHGLVSPRGAAGALALAVIVATMTFVGWGLIRTGVRLARQVLPG